MGFFRYDPEKPGPGIEKDTPRKKGPARFFEVLFRDFGNLVRINLLYVLCILPALVALLASIFFLLTGNIPLFLGIGLLGLALAIPLGPAKTAMVSLITKMLRDEPGFFWHDFKKAFSSNFRAAILPGLVYALVVGALCIAVVYTLGVGGADFIAVVVYLVATLLFAMAAPYYFVQAAYLDLKPGAILKNSFLLALAHAPRSIAGALFYTGLLVIQVLFFPFSLVFTLFIGYSIPCLVQLLWIWPPVDKTFQIEQTLRNRQDEQTK